MALNFSSYASTIKNTINGLSIPNKTSISYYNGGVNTTYTYNYDINYNVTTTPAVTGDKIATGNIIDESYILTSFNNTLKSVLAQLDNVLTAPTLYLGSCHSSCHSSCHNSRGRR